MRWGKRRSVLAFQVLASAVWGLSAVAVLEPMLIFTHYMYNLPQTCRWNEHALDVYLRRNYAQFQIPTPCCWRLLKEKNQNFYFLLALSFFKSWRWLTRSFYHEKKKIKPLQLKNLTAWASFKSTIIAREMTALESTPSVPIHGHSLHAVQAFGAPPTHTHLFCFALLCFLLPACCVQEDFRSSIPRDSPLE